MDDVGVDPPEDGPLEREPPEIALSLEALSTPCEDRLEYEALEGTPPADNHNYPLKTANRHVNIRLSSEKIHTRTKLIPTGEKQNTGKCFLPANFANKEGNCI